MFYCIVLCCIVLHCVALYCIVMYCTIFYSILLYSTVLYCIVLYLKISYFLFIGSYLVDAQVGGKIRYYDATTYNGTNIGPYANMLGVMDALRDVVDRSTTTTFTEFSEREWKSINDELASKNNACFRVSREDLEVRTTRDIPKSANPIEIFVSYGDIGSYWIAGIVREPQS